MAVLGALILLRVPTKPELTLPILLAATVFLAVHLSARWTAALLACSLLSGVFSLSPYDRDGGHFGLHVQSGHLGKTIEDAYDNRMTAGALTALLGRLPEHSVLVGRIAWSDAQARAARIETVQDYRGIPGLVAFRFAGLPGDRVVVSFQDGKLKELLGRQHELAGGMYYDVRLAGMLRRWMDIEITESAKPVVVLAGSPLRQLLAVVGRSVAQIAANTR
jgi:hypothetical protein